MRARIPLFLLALTAVSTPGFAQQSPAPPPLPPPPDATTEAPIPIPPLPDVNDPMLAPMPPATRNITTLEEALSLVKARSTDLATAKQEIEKAIGLSRSALAGILLSINGNVVGTHNFITQQTQILTGTSTTPSLKTAESPNPNFLTGGVAFVQPIVNMAALQNWGTAKEFEKATQLDLTDVQRQVSLGLASALVSVVTAERVAELNRVGFRTSLERLDLTRRRRTLGAATGLDVVRAQADVESARATLVTGDESLIQAREALGLAVGLPQPIGVAKELRIDGIEQSAVAACKAVADLEARADIAAARQRVYVADRRADNVKLQFLPSINAQSSIATTTIDTGSTPNTTWNIQAVLSIPLWEGGARYGALRTANANTREAEISLEALRRKAAIQLAQAQRGVTVTESSRKVAADARALAAEVDRLVRAGYAQGQGTSLDLVTAAFGLRQAEINLALAEFNVVQARVLAVLSLATCPF
jgi:outer membrane protein, multidrug efflux system